MEYNKGKFDIEKHNVELIVFAIGRWHVTRFV
jgi:hypothetical protein